MRNKLFDYFDGFFDAIRKGEPEAELKMAYQMIFEFGQYVDMFAAANPHRLHHVYEWGRVGDADSRLFELTAIPSGAGVVITYDLLPSSTPNENGVVFVDKATVMESGQYVTVTTDKPVPINNGESFRVGSFTFVPGGPATGGAFQETFMLYFSTRGSISGGTAKLSTGKPTYGSGYNDGMRIYDSIIGK